MIIVPVKEDDNIERVLKRYKKKFDRTGRMRELRRRQAFNPPSATKRKQREKAIYVQKLRQAEED